MVRFLTYSPAIGLLGLAVYQVCYSHDVTAAFHTLGQAAALFGIGTGAHALKTQS